MLANDSDVDLDSDEYDLLSFVEVHSASAGTTSIYNNEFVVVEFDPGFSGNLSLQYTIEDEQNVADDGTVLAVVSSTHATTLSGSALRDLIIGTALGENINGLEGDDDLFGRDGDDNFNGGDGGDRIDGGEGYDTVNFAGSNIGVHADLGSRIGQGGFAQGDTYISIEALSGTQFADGLAGDTGDNLLIGLAGNDDLSGRDGIDILDAGEGDDHLEGGKGADDLRGGEGSDTADYFFSDAAVQVSLEAGTATGGDAEGDQLSSIENLNGSDFDDILEGDGNANRLDGGRGADQLIGGAGDDILIGGRGADQLIGGEGRDRADYSQSATAVSVNMSNGAAGGGDAEGDTFSSIELVVGSFHDDTIIGDASDNIIMGGRGADQIDGGAGFDVADYSEADEAVTVDLGTGLGSAGEAAGDQLSNIEMLVGSNYGDTLSGSAGNEEFDGGLGDDLLQGAAGSDVYYFGFNSDNDTITEIGLAADIDRLLLDADVNIADVSIVREGDDLLVELEQFGNVLTDTVRVVDHFLGRETGIEEIAFADGTVWDRDAIDSLQRNGRLNATDDIIRFANEDVELIIDASRLTGNDATEGTDALQIISVQNAVNANVSLAADGSVVFTGALDFYGDAFFDYTIRDEHGRESTARAEVNVLPINDAPIAVDDGIYQGIEDIPLVIAVSDLVGNDIDVDGDLLSIVAFEFGPALDINGDPLYPSFFGFGSNGNARLSGSNVTFDASLDHYGYAGFTYTITDGNGETSIGQVELNFIGVNDAPTARKDDVTARLGRSELINISILLANDEDVEGDAFHFAGAHSPTNGAVTLLSFAEVEVSDPADAYYIRFDAVALGDATVIYDVIDDLGAQSSGTIEIDVIPLNDPPIARNDSGFETLEDQIIIIDVADLLANDTDPNGDALTITGFEPFPLNGTVVWTNDGKIQFTPRADYNGEAGFTYFVTDGKDLGTSYEGVDSAFVAISIVPDNDGPWLGDDVLAGLEDLPITVIPAEAFANDVDPEGDVIFFDSANILGVLTNDFTNRDEYQHSTNLATPVLDATATIVEATLDDGSPLPAWLLFDAATQTFSGVPTDSSAPAFDVSLTFTYTDPVTSEIATFEDNQSIDPADTQGLNDGVVYDPHLMVIAAGDGIFSAAMSTGRPLPAWLSFDAASNTFAKTAIAPDAGENIARVWVSFEPDDAAIEPFIIEVLIDPNTPIEPAINALLANQSYFAAQGMMVLPTASESTITADKANGFDLPNWLSFNEMTLTFTGTPPETYVGSIPVRIDIGASTETPAYALIRDVVIDETLELGDNIGFSLSVFDELIDLVRPEDFYGSFAIEYYARDVKGAVSDEPAIIVINVAPQRELPDAADDVFGVDEDGTLEITLAELLANDVDDDGDHIHVTMIDTASIGNLTINIPELSIDLPPVSGLLTDATHSATLADGSALPAWLSIDIETGRLFGTPPLEAHELLDLIVTSNDVNGNHLSAVQIDVDGNEGVTLTYVTEPEFSGSVTFNYTATDGSEGDDTALVNIDVAAVNDPPIAVDDDVQGIEDTVLIINPTTLLANDTDIDGDALRISSVLNANNGEVELIAGEIHFTPDNNFDGEASFDYVVTDDIDGSTTGHVNVEIIADNTAPIAALDTFNGIEDTPFVITLADLMGNDSDPEGDAISFVEFEALSGDGQVFELPDGTYALTPRDNINGDVAFTYRITDGRLNSGETGNIVVNFAAVNDAPVAAGDSGYATIEDTAIAIDLADLLANDSDIESDALTISSLFDPINGAVEIIGGQAIFTPRADYFGNGGFSYQVSDGNGGLGTGFVAVSVTPSEDLPVTVSDSGWIIDEDTFLIIDPAELLANDFDPDGDTISFTGATGSGVEVLGDGSIQFTPGADQNGIYLLNYTISDGNNPDVSGEFSVEVRPIDDDPTARDDSFAGVEDETLIIPIAQLTANDNDVDGHSFVVTSLSNAIGGIVSFDGVGNILFVPDQDRNTTASFEYTLTDISGATDTASVNISLQPVNDAPTIGTISPMQGSEDSLFTAQLPANLFSDVDGDILSISVRKADGTPLPTWLSFTSGINELSGLPPTNFNGILELEVVASDGFIATKSAFSLIIDSVNDAPVVANALADQSSNEDEAVSFILPADAFSDVDGDALTLSATLADTSPLPTWLSFDATSRTFSGTPPLNFNGAIAVSVTASDGSLAASDTFTLDITSINDAPVVANALADQASNEDEAVSFILPADAFSDVDGDALTLSATLADTSPLPTWLSFDATSRTFSGTPPLNFNGAIAVSVTASDGSLAASDTFTLDITSINDAPVVANALADQSSNEDEAVSFILPADAFSDVDGDALTLSATLADTSPLPAWLSFDATSRTFSGTPPLNFNGAIAVSVTASDGSLAASDTFTLDITSINDAPVVANALADQSSNEDEAVSFILPADAFSDVDGDALTLSATLADTSPLPTWLSFDATSRTFSGTPPLNFNGAIAVSVTASDGTLAASDTFTLDITSINDAPVVANALADQSSNEDEAVSFILPADAFSDVDGDALTLSATLADTSPLPAWLSFDATSRTFSPVPRRLTSMVRLQSVLRPAMEHLPPVIHSRWILPRSMMHRLQ